MPVTSQHLWGIPWRLTLGEDPEPKAVAEKLGQPLVLLPTQGPGGSPMDPHADLGENWDPLFFLAFPPAPFGDL